MVPILEFADRLAAVPEPQFTHENILRFLQENVVDASTLSPYLFICEEHYTRNLIRKTELFELIAICWDVGQKSPIHNHRDQRCWMAMAWGKLQVHNFELVKKDQSRSFCELKSGGQIVIDSRHPTEVDPEEPIHQVLNLPSFESRAVSLHIYSRPFETCEVYDLKEKRYEDVQLFNTTEYGKILPTDWEVHPFTLA